MALICHPAMLSTTANPIDGLDSPAAAFAAGQFAHPEIDRGDRAAEWSW
jgi:hypothetical protein